MGRQTGLGRLKGYWSTLGIILGAFFLISGFIGWALGIEFSNTARHSITVPYAQLALLVSPILIVGGVILFFMSLVVRTHAGSPTPPPATPPELVEYRKKRSISGQVEERTDEDLE